MRSYNFSINLIYFQNNFKKEFMKKIFLVLLLSMFIYGCGKNSEAEKYVNKANSFIANQNYEAAVEILDECIEEFPDYAEAYNKRGMALDYLGEYFDAKKNYKTAIELDPEFAQAYVNLGNSFSNMKSYSEAIYCYEKAIELKPSLARVYYYLGLAQIERGDRQTGIMNIKKSANMTYKQAQDYLRNNGEDW